MSVGQVAQLDEVSFSGWPSAELLRQAFATEERLRFKCDSGSFELTVNSLAVAAGCKRDDRKDKWVIEGLVSKVDIGSRKVGSPMRFRMDFSIDTRQGKLLVFDE